MAIRRAERWFDVEQVSFELSQLRRMDKCFVAELWSSDYISEIGEV